MSKAVAALLVDPGVFTGPYDAALAAGLQAAGVRVRFAGRGPRRGETYEIPPDLIETIYYPGVQETAKGSGPLLKLRKAASHVLSNGRLLKLARKGQFDVVHFQWAVLPVLDAPLMRRLARRRPVILTVHDLAPFNGSPTSKLQTVGFDRALQAATRIVVHTEAARETLIGRGHDPRHVATIPHGPLTLSTPIPPRAPRDPAAPWTIVLFGKIQAYKGVDLLLEALGRLPAQDRARLKVVIAGEPFIPMEPLLALAAEHRLGDTVEFRLKRLDDGEMASLFASADAFVFPYRHIEASGVLHLILPYGRWIVASDLGAFRELLVGGHNGDLVPVGDPDALAAALLASIDRSCAPGDETHVVGWDEIGARTRALYEDALAQYAGAPNR